MFLLLTTVPPRDERPDAVALGLTRASYAEMLRMAVAAVNRIRGGRLIVKLHPRAGDDPAARQVLRQFPSLAARVVRGGALERWVARADCVLSCPSSAAVEAASAGVPVIQLLAPGSGDVLPHRAWGLFGTARTEAQLDSLLAQVLAGQAAPSVPNPSVFANRNGSPAAEIAREILAGLRKPALPFRALCETAQTDR